VTVVLEAVKGGVRFVLLRERDLEGRAYAALAETLVAALPPSVVLTVHGRPQVAAALGAGLHLSEAAPPCTAAAPWHGRSVHGPDAAARARREGAAYVVAGTIFSTAGKRDAPLAGAAGLRAMCAAADPLPVYAIGGVNATRVAAMRRAGAYGVAVVGAILEADAPKAAARALVEALDRALD
jgi:thiamine-phosphate diphosphorylase